MNFTQALHRSAQLHPNTAAVICNGRTTTYAQLLQRVARLAGGLRTLGLREGNVVAMMGFNSDHYLEYFLAVPWAGGICSPQNFRWSLAELIPALNESEAVIAFVDDAFSPHAEALIDGCPFLRALIYCGEGSCPQGLISLEDLIARSEPLADVVVDEDETYGIFYTGGTTGRSKGVMLSHRNILCSAISMMTEGAFAEGSVGLQAAPMFHLAGLMMTTSLVLRGGTNVMLPAFRPDTALALIAQHRITDLLLVPTMLQVILDSPAMAASDISSVRHLMYGASPITGALLRRAMQTLSHVGFFQVYGMTELGATATMLTPSAHRAALVDGVRLASAGHSFLHAQIEIIDSAGQPVPTGTVGEIRVRGSNVMQGYLKQPEATAATLKNGWLHTGDMGYLDAGGYLFIVDRLKDMIISGGENVYSVEVENIVAQHPAVASCAVVGINHAEWGEAVHAVVVLRAGASLTLSELVAHCKQHIAGYKCPRSLSLAPSLPVSPAGKVLKNELRKQLSTGG